MQVRKAVIPAAGLGTRFLPITKAVPKELLPILDRPMLQYVVEEAAEAGVEEVIVVTARGKESIASLLPATSRSGSAPGRGRVRRPAGVGPARLNPCGCFLRDPG